MLEVTEWMESCRMVVLSPGTVSWDCWDHKRSIIRYRTVPYGSNNSVIIFWNLLHCSKCMYRTIPYRTIQRYDNIIGIFVISTYVRLSESRIQYYGTMLVKTKKDSVWCVMEKSFFPSEKHHRNYRIFVIFEKTIKKLSIKQDRERSVSNCVCNHTPSIDITLNTHYNILNRQKHHVWNFT